MTVKNRTFREIKIPEKTCLGDVCLVRSITRIEGSFKNLTTQKELQSEGFTSAKSAVPDKPAIEEHSKCLLQESESDCHQAWPDKHAGHVGHSKSLLVVVVGTR